VTPRAKIYTFAKGQAVDGGVTTSEVADRFGWPRRWVSATMGQMTIRTFDRLIRVDIQGKAHVYVRADEAHLYGN
jgi:hypothetical protein